MLRKQLPITEQVINDNIRLVKELAGSGSGDLASNIISTYRANPDYHDCLFSFLALNISKNNLDLINIVNGLVGQSGVHKPVLVDIGCYSGRNFSAPLAKSNPDLYIVGVDAFPLEDLNNDPLINGIFESSDDAAAYMTSMHGLDNLRFHPLAFGFTPEDISRQNEFIRNLIGNHDYLAITGIKAPVESRKKLGNLADTVLDTGVRQNADLIICVPSNLSYIDNNSFPQSNHLKGRLRSDIIKEIISLPYGRIKKCERFTPATPNDSLIYHVAGLAKQLVVIDMGIKLIEAGYHAEIMKYDSGAVSPNTPEHILIAEKN